MKADYISDSSGNKIYTLSIRQAHVFALWLLPVLLLGLVLPYYLIWGKNVMLELAFKPFMFLLLFILIGVIIHEGLHGLVWALFSKKGFRSIHFGFKWEYLTPYCHCSSPLRVWQYSAGALAPLIFMGLAPVFLAFLWGKHLLMFFGVFYIWTSAGDILSFWILRNFKLKSWVFDHESEMGFIIKNENNS